MEARSLRSFPIDIDRGAVVLCRPGHRLAQRFIVDLRLREGGYIAQTGADSRPELKMDFGRGGGMERAQLEALTEPTPALTTTSEGWKS